MPIESPVPARLPRQASAEADHTEGTQSLQGRPPGVPAQQIRQSRNPLLEARVTRTPLGTLARLGAGEGWRGRTCVPGAPCPSQFRLREPGVQPVPGEGRPSHGVGGGLSRPGRTTKLGVGDNFSLAWQRARLVQLSHRTGQAGRRRPRTRPRPGAPAPG
jgi:hypothetical protein